jgi:tRNA1(Val) A37 N6-methylase TrmN6
MRNLSLPQLELSSWRCLLHHIRTAQSALDFSTVATELRRKRVANVPRCFRQTVQGKYDIVIGNPPYVRPHRLSFDEDTLRTYGEVAQGQIDLYILFLYRALRGWVNKGGRVSFIVPIIVLEASYAAPPRRVLGEFRRRPRAFSLR